MGVVVWWPERMKNADARREETREAYKLQQRIDEIARKHREWEQLARRRYHEHIANNFKLTEEHVKLLKRGYWVLEDETDYASVAMSGKYPFGNGDWYQDVYDILEWPITYDKDGVEKQWREKAADIMAELPHALKAILDSLKPDTAVQRYHDYTNTVSSAWKG
jgi:hypothetical protein